MQHLSITFPQDLRKRLDLQAKREGTQRSTLIQKAVRVYLGLRRREELRRLLIEGYQEMAHEARDLGREFENADRDSLKSLD